MFICDDFVFLHVPKTAGTFVSNVLTQLYGELGRPYQLIDKGRHQLAEGETLSKHAFLDAIPPEDRGKNILVSVRNPFTHYHSLYRFGWWKEHPDSMFVDAKMQERYPRYPELTLAEFVEASMDWSLSPKDDAALLRNSGIGPLTRRYIRYCCEDADQLLQSLTPNRPLSPAPNLHIIHSEHANDELCNFLEKEIGIETPALDFIRQAPRENVTKNTDTVNYTSTTWKQVAKYEQRVFELFPEYKPSWFTPYLLAFRKGDAQYA